MKFVLTPAQERIEGIDALRGFALSGIVIVHFVEQYFAGPAPEAITQNAFGSPVDGFIAGMIGFLLQGKFFALFSILFGLSFYIQMERAAERNMDFTRIFIWRILLLFIIGFLHSCFYRGDILTLYAFVALFLIPFYRLPNQVILGVAGLLFLGVGRYIVFAFNGDDPLFGIPAVESTSEETLDYYNILKNGSLLEVWQINAWYGNLTKLEFQFGIFNRGYLTLAYFLIGLWLGKIGLFKQVEHYKKQLRRGLFIAIAGFFVGGLFTGLMFSNSGMTNETGFHNWFAVLGLTGVDITNISITTIILIGFLLLYLKPGWQKFFMRLAPYGRTALTNYFMQSVIGTFIFFGWGMGYLGAWSNLQNLLIAFGILAAQIYISNWWLKQFKYGPLEWLWRSATYFKWQPFK